MINLILFILAAGFFAHAIGKAKRHGYDEGFNDGKKKAIEMTVNHVVDMAEEIHPGIAAKIADRIREPEKIDAMNNG